MEGTKTPSVSVPPMVVPTSKGTPAMLEGVPVKVQPTPKNMVDTVITSEGKSVPGNYPTFDKSIPRKTETVVKAVPGAITQQGGRTAFITEAVRVLDGDTAEFKDPSNPRGDKTVVCRLGRIEADETAKPAMRGNAATSGQPYGNKATQTLKDMVMDKQVTVTVTQLYDNRGKRSVCEIEVNGENINQKMLEQGAAWIYRTYGKNSKTPSYADQIAEAKAKTNGLGLFASRNPEYPGDYKRRIEKEARAD